MYTQERATRKVSYAVCPCPTISMRSRPVQRVRFRALTTGPASTLTDLFKRDVCVCVCVFWCVSLYLYLMGSVSVTIRASAMNRKPIPFLEEHKLRKVEDLASNLFSMSFFAVMLTS